MSDKKENLEKLKKLCNELSDRDLQIKVNALALWDVIDAVAMAKESLSESLACSCENASGIKDSIKKLEDVLEGISAKGCRRVQDGH